MLLGILVVFVVGSLLCYVVGCLSLLGRCLA